MHRFAYENWFLIKIIGISQYCVVKIFQHGCHNYQSCKSNVDVRTLRNTKILSENIMFTRNTMEFLKKFFIEYVLLRLATRKIKYSIWSTIHGLNLSRRILQKQLNIHFILFLAEKLLLTLKNLHDFLERFLNYHSVNIFPLVSNWRHGDLNLLFKMIIFCVWHSRLTWSFEVMKCHSLFRYQLRSY